MKCPAFCCAIALVAVATSVTAPARANDITTEWATVKPPPVPELKPATIDPKTTALLVLDFMKANCGTRPRCAATIPNVNKLIEAARANTNAYFDYAGQMLTVKSLAEAVELSTAHLRKQFEVLTAQTKDLSALAQKVATETSEPIKSGMSRAFSKVS